MDAHPALRAVDGDGHRDEKKESTQHPEYCNGSSGEMVVSTRE